ncbi:MAG TPA: hypothetical protein VK859_13855 [bacterium]|nr:hypothetical protein [bacterium]
MPEIGDIQAGTAVYMTTPIQYNNSAWMLAGPEDPVSGDVTPRIWYSADGANWAVVDNNPPDVGPLVTMNNKLWLYGYDGVWVYQPNGTPTIVPTPTFTFTFTPTPTFTPTSTFTPTLTPTATFTPSPTFTATPLGNNWQESNPDPGFDPRESSQVVSLNGTMYLIGGHASLHNDVWYSNDGFGWSEDLDAGFSGRYGHTALVFDPSTGLSDGNSQIWVIGGFDGAGENDVWSSPDGNNWNEAVTHASFSPRYYQTGLVFNGKMWIMGGEDNTSAALNDVWSSPDGVNWTQSQTGTIWPARYRHSSFVDNGKMWIVGGTNGTQYYNDVWCSSDGVNWSEPVTQAAFSARAGHTSAVLNGVMYLVAGQDATGYLNDLWSSQDGAHWQPSPLGNGFSPRTNQSSVIFNNALWVIAGNTAAGFAADVWFAPPFPPTPTPTNTPVILSCPSTLSWSTKGPCLGMALDAQGNVYSIDEYGAYYANKDVEIFTAQGQPVTSWGNGQLNGPNAIAVDATGLVYIASSNNMVMVFNGVGNSQRQWGGYGTGPSEFLNPIGIAVNSPLNRVYVADTNRLDIFDLTGSPIAQVGSTPNGGIVNPGGIALDPQGNVYMTDVGWVEVFDPQGNYLREWDATLGTSLQTTQYVSVDSHGLVYVTDGNGNIGIFDTYGNVYGSTTGGVNGIAAGNGVWYEAVGAQINQVNICNLNGVPIGSGASPTLTSTSTPTISPTPNSQTATPTWTPTGTFTWTPSSTPTFTQTYTATLTSTYTNSPTPTNTNSPTPTYTNSFTPTSTFTNSFSPTPTFTNTSSPTPTFTNSFTISYTFTKTLTPTPTYTATYTTTPTPTKTNTPTSTPTSLPPTPTKTNTAAITSTPTKTFTPTITLTPTKTTTYTLTMTSTLSPTKTPTPANSPTKTPTFTVTGTFTKTATFTYTVMKTFTGTKTFTPTITPTPTATTACGTNNTALALLEEYTTSCGSNSVYHLFAVVNNGAAVTLSDITIKFWPYDTSGVNLVGSITTGGCVWNPTCSHNVTGTTLSALNFSPACGPTTTQMANWEMTVSTTDSTVLSGGTSWVGLQTLVNRSDNQPFVPGTSYWYSPCVMASTYTMNSHYAIYLRGNLVTAAGGIPPSCRPLPTCTPHGGSMAPVVLGHEGTATPTSTPTPLPTVNPGLVQSIVAAPNISNGQQPIRFLAQLNQGAKVDLAIFTIAGEEVFSTEMEGTQGLNTLAWNAQNNARQAVADGLYFYVVRVDNGVTAEVKNGKIVIIH